MKKFVRQDIRKKKLKEKWRRPKGRDSKMRHGNKARGKHPGPGFRKPVSIRGLIGGYEEIKVANIKDLETLELKKQRIVIAKTVGKRKQLEIVKKAKEKNLKISNFRELTL